VRVVREEFLQTLESVTAGLAKREEVEQSSCFVFSHGLVQTFNEQVSCTSPSPLPKDVRGAVQSKRILDFLRKTPDEEVTVALKKDRMVLTAPHRRADLALQAEILLPVDLVETPSEWSPLHEDFCTALTLVSECADKDEERFTGFVHVHPRWLEAFDNVQGMRFKLKTGASTPLMVRKESLKQVPLLGMTEVSETPSWLHFRNPSKTTLSCRKWVDAFPNLTEALKDTGSPVKLPKELISAIDLAADFSDDALEDKTVTILLSGARIVVVGEGVGGRFEQEIAKPTKWEGEEVSFRIPPKVLSEVVHRHRECCVSQNFLSVSGEKWKYFSLLGKV
jgi:hypothetical protein